MAANPAKGPWPKNDVHLSRPRKKSAHGAGILLWMPNERVAVLRKESHATGRDVSAGSPRKRDWRYLIGGQGDTLISIERPVL